LSDSTTIKQIKDPQNNRFTSLAQTMKARMATFDEIEIFKIKQHVDFLYAVEGNGTSLLTIMIGGTMGQFHQMRQKLSDELGCASNIKDRVNRQSV
jgi:peptide subunit release factor 1 (eRF1)